MTQLLRSEQFRALAKRVPEADIRDRKIEGEIFKLLEGHEGDWSDNHDLDGYEDVWHRRDADDHIAFDTPPRYLSDFGAALSTKPDGYLVTRLSQDVRDASWSCFIVMPGKGGGYAQSSDAIRALIAASLSARATLEEEKERAITPQGN